MVTFAFVPRLLANLAGVKYMFHGSGKGRKG